MPANHNYYVSSSKVLVHNSCLPKLGVSKHDAVNMAEASAKELMDYANAYNNLYKIGKVQPMTRDQATYFVKLLRKKGVKVRIDGPHIGDKVWNIDHLNVGPEGKAHIPIEGR